MHLPKSRLDEPIMLNSGDCILLFCCTTSDKRRTASRRRLQTKTAEIPFQSLTIELNAAFGSAAIYLLSLAGHVAFHAGSSLDDSCWSKSLSGKQSILWMHVGNLKRKCIMG
jgi:hypothetical protein